MEENKIYIICYDRVEGTEMLAYHLTMEGAQKSYDEALKNLKIQFDDYVNFLKEDDPEFYEKFPEVFMEGEELFIKEQIVLP